MASAQSSPDSSLLDVMVELDGFSVVDLLPANYTSTRSPNLDATAINAKARLEENVSMFVSARCGSLVQQVYQTYGLLTRGFACKIKSSDYKTLANLPGVKSVWKLPNFVPFLNTSTKVIGANDAWKMVDKNGLKITGQGQLIGVIDTGLDYRHPDLGGSSGPKSKVVDNYDFAEGSDVAEDGQQHGTHVAGICAANGKLKGVAPEAKLAGYKVFMKDDNKSTNVGANVLAALERALTSKCNVVNLSLGSPGGSSGDDEGSGIYHKAVKAGLMVVAAAGNNGSRAIQQPFVVGSPSTYAPVLSVAASDDMEHPEIKIVKPADTRHRIIGSEFDLPPKWTDSEYEVVDCGYGYEKDFEGKDVKGKIALIQRGPPSDSTAYFRDKDLNAAKAGAVGCIIYNHSPGIFQGTMKIDDGDEKKSFVPALAITQGQGESLKTLIREGLVVKVAKGEPFAQIADFSSSGPSMDIKFKPEVCAPGVGIYSTVTTTKTKSGERQANWAVMQGTSMASPHVTGAVALLRQAVPTADPKQIKAMFMSSADLLFNPLADEYVPLLSQGSGRINIPAAINCPAIFDPPAGALKAVQGKISSLFKLQNITKKPVKVELSYYSLGETTTAEIKPGTLNLKPGAQSLFEVSIICNEDSKGFLEGIVFASIDGKKVHLPIMILNGSSEVPKQVSEIKVNRPVMTFGSATDGPITITFKFNHGSYATNVPGREVSSNYGAVRIKLVDDKGVYLGTILSDDTLEIGYHKIVWKGFDHQGRLFATDGDYKLSGVGLYSMTNPNTRVPDFIEKDLPVMADVSIRSSPLPTVPRVQFKIVPSSPRFDESFKIYVYTTRLPKLKNVKLEIGFGKDSYIVDGIIAEKLFGGSDIGKTTNVQIIQNDGKVLFETRADPDFIDDHEGTMLMLNCTPHQEGATSITVKDVTFDTAYGPVAPIARGLMFSISKDYSFFDLNRDGVVDELDADLLSSSLGKKTGQNGYDENHDLDGDGDIDMDDLAILAKHFGQSMYPP